MARTCCWRFRAVSPPAPEWSQVAGALCSERREASECQRASGAMQRFPAYRCVHAKRGSCNPERSVLSVAYGRSSRPRSTRASSSKAVAARFRRLRAARLAFGLYELEPPLPLRCNTRTSAGAPLTGRRGPVLDARRSTCISPTLPAQSAQRQKTLICPAARAAEQTGVTLRGREGARRRRGGPARRKVLTTWCHTGPRSRSAPGLF